MSQIEALSTLSAMKQALEKATEVMEAACIRVDELKAENESLRQAIAEAEKQEPVAWMFQHEDTGLTDCVDVQQIEWGFENNNPRWKKIGPLYTTPQPKQEQSTECVGEPVAWYISNNGEPISEPTFDRNEAEQILAGQIEDCGSILSKLYTTPYVPEGRQQRPSKGEDCQSDMTWVNATTWRGLTDEEVLNLFYVSRFAKDNYDGGAFEFYKAAEAKLREKNSL